MITNERWTEAQNSESSYWTGVDAAELLRICAEKPLFLSMLRPEGLRACFDQKDVLDIGCGPLGISIASMQPYRATTTLTKIEPLPQVSLDSLPARGETWAAEFLDWTVTLSQHGEYLKIPAEDLTLSSRFDTVLTYNVLDHVQDPQRILSNAFAALRPGGTVIVGVDCRSLLARLKFELIVRHLYKNDTIVKAHPFSFAPGDIVRLLRKAGFHDIVCRGLPTFAKRFIGGAYRPMFIGKKRGETS